MKKTFLKTFVAIMLTLGLSPKANSAVTVNDIKNLLEKYCYPLSADCGTGYEPIYDSQKSSCTCPNLTHTYYSSKDRRCQPKCPAGYKLKAVTKCPGGSFKLEVK